MGEGSAGDAVRLYHSWRYPVCVVLSVSFPSIPRPYQDDTPPTRLLPASGEPGRWQDVLPGSLLVDWCPLKQER